MHDELGVADEFEQRVGLVGKAPVLGEEGAVEPVHALGILRHVALGIEIALGSAGRRGCG